MNIPDSTRHELLDELNRVSAGLVADKVADAKVEDCHVIDFDPVTMVAEVLPLRGFQGAPIQVRVQTPEQGQLPGTGTAYGLYVDRQNPQVVQVSFVNGSPYSLYCSGVATGSVYTPTDKPAPAYAPWQQDGTGWVRVTALPDGRFGNAEHVSASSKVSRTLMGEANIEDWSHEHVVVNGENTTRAEEQLRESASAFKAAARRLGVEV